jgi:hypothetical protein
VRMGQEKEEEEGLIFGRGRSGTHLTSLGDSDRFASPPAASALHSVQCRQTWPTGRPGTAQARLRGPRAKPGTTREGPQRHGPCRAGPRAEK